MKSEIVKQYYSSIDSNDISKILTLFSKEIVYYRNEKVFNGLKELEHFFKKERTISGKHRDLKIIEKEGAILVKGVFTGFQEKNKVNFPFVDKFWFDSTGKISKRISTFSPS